MVQYKKSYGQHILSDAGIIRKILSQVPIADNDVVELGPGTGNLTQKILQLRPASFTAIEKDQQMINFLEEKLPDQDNLKLLFADFLKADLDRLPKKFVFISNLPYYITTQILRRLCSIKERIIKAVVMTQYEYFQRINATPGNRQFSSITVYIRSFFDVAPCFKVKKGSFFPPPNVDSYVFTLSPNQLTDKIEDFDFYNHVVRAAFSKRRKQMASVLGREEFIGEEKTEIQKQLVSLGHPETVRPESLSVDDFILLASRLHKK